MPSRGAKTFAGLAAAVLVTAGLGLAQVGSEMSSPASPDRGQDVVFNRTTQFANGDSLAPGTYWMEVSQDSGIAEVNFYREYSNEFGNPDPGRHAIASTEARVVPEDFMNQRTVVDFVNYGSGPMVTQIKPGGWHERLIFSPAADRGPEY